MRKTDKIINLNNVFCKSWEEPRITSIGFSNKKGFSLEMTISCWVATQWDPWSTAHRGQKQFLELAISGIFFAVFYQVNRSFNGAIYYLPTLNTEKSLDYPCK